MTNTGAEELGNEVLDSSLGTAPAEVQRSWLAQHGLSYTDAVTLAIGGLFTVARSPMSAFPLAWQLALLALLGAPGLVVVASRVVRGDVVSMLLGLFLLSSAASALRSPGPRYSLIGDIGAMDSVLALTLVAGWWGAGTALGVRARAVLPWVLLAGVAANAVVGLFQIALDIRSGPLGTFSGRASGLMHNPIRYGTLCVGLSCWALHRAGTRAGMLSAGLVIAVTFATGLSGSRAAAIVVLGVATSLVLVRRTSTSVAALGAAAVGLVMATAYVALAGSRHLATRFSDGEGPGSRVTIWRYSVEAWLERPIFGWGPVHFGSATSPRYSLDFTRAGGLSDDQLWTDPHNIVVLLLTTTGIVGLSFAIAFVAAALRRGVDIELLIIAAGMSLVWFLQAPRSTLPIAMLVFGAALRPDRFNDRAGGRPGSVRRAVATLSVIAGVVLASYVVIGDLRFRAALDSADPIEVEHAAEWFYRDPTVAQYVSEWLSNGFRSGRNDADLDASVRWAKRAVDYNPRDPAAWIDLASAQLTANDFAGTRVSLDRALELQPWNPETHRLMIRYAAATDRADLAAEAVEALCQLQASAICA